MSPRRSRRGHHARDTLLVLVLVAFIVIAAVVQIAEHLALLAIIVAVAAGAYYLGRHGRRQARPAISPRPGRVHTAEPAATAPLPVATLPLADDQDEAGADRHARVYLTESDETITPASRQPGILPAGSDRDSLIAAPMSGARPLWGPS